MKSYHPTIILTSIFFLLSLSLFSQKSSITGTVADSLGLGLPAATVVLMQAEDSLMTSFGVTESDGYFEIKRVATGDYLLQVSYVGFDTYWTSISVSPDMEKTKLGTIVLAPASSDLSEIEVTAEHVPLRMSNDTLTYNADAFKTQPGSVVEDLLKKLPGVEVDRDGTVRAQGEVVQNVLVDGKEFFGADPQIATKNLPADAVDQVQVFDKKSDRAEFTGIEDGRDQKSINLELKDDKKNGHFGNAELAGGASEQTDGSLDTDRYSGRFNLNRFSPNTQLSLIGMGNNINEQGFSFEDYLQFMGGLSGLMGRGSGGGGGRVRLEFDPSSMGIPMEGFGLDQGFTSTQAGGLNMNHEMGKKTDLNASYFYSNIENELSRTATKESIFDDENFASEEAGSRNTRNQNHRVNMTLRHEIDSLQKITLRSNVGYNEANLRSDNTARTFGNLGILENENATDLNSNGKNKSMRSSLAYMRRFNRPGRAFVADLEWGMEEDERKAQLTSQNAFYDGGNLIGNEAIDQSQFFKDDAQNFGLGLSWTEPLGKLFKKKGNYLEVSASRRHYRNDSEKKFFDILPNGESLNPELSNRFKRKYRYDRGGIGLQFNRKKFNLNLGAEVQNARLEGESIDDNFSVNQDFTRVLPRLFLDYELGLSKNFRFEYSTNFREPQPEQLQPVVDNSDPLNIFIGNPELKPAYEHMGVAEFMFFDQFSFTSLFASAEAIYTQDRIVNSSFVDSLFRQNLKPINIANDLVLQGNLDFRTPIRALKMNLRLSYRNMLNESILFVNGVENDVSRNRHSFGFSFDNRKKKLFDLTIGGRITFNSTKYSVSSTLDQKYLDRRAYADLIVTPTKKWKFESTFDLTFYSAETFGQKRTVPIWMAGITRNILPDSRGQITFAAHDILNKNIGLNRTSDLNFVQEERVTSLGRFLLLKFAYSISGFEREEGGIEIRMGGDR